MPEFYIGHYYKMFKKSLIENEKQGMETMESIYINNTMHLKHKIYSELLKPQLASFFMLIM